MSITISPNRQSPGQSVTVRISGQEVDTGIYQIRFSSATGETFDVTVKRIDDNTVEVETGADWPVAGYNVIGLDHALPPQEKFTVVNGYLIS
ncbi:hypothetical protein [Enterobacter mori]|uniref:hypothetical protein n=1 Tax=Enterobacter mori TaxID=539813 RepID=UPI002B21177C|nr:hypothetical protein [Enterobacter mori]MEA5206376.1 hypothetical protein [Enterobacter mori]